MQATVPLPVRQAPVNGLYSTIQDVGHNSMAPHQAAQQVHRAGLPHIQKQPSAPTTLQTQVPQPVRQLPLAPAPLQAAHQTASRPPPPINHDQSLRKENGKTKDFEQDDIYGDKDSADDNFL